MKIQSLGIFLLGISLSFAACSKTDMATKSNSESIVEQVSSSEDTKTSPSSEETTKTETTKTNSGYLVYEDNTQIKFNYAMYSLLDNQLTITPLILSDSISLNDLANQTIDEKDIQTDAAFTLDVKQMLSDLSSGDINDTLSDLYSVKVADNQIYFLDLGEGGMSQVYQSVYYWSNEKTYEGKFTTHYVIDEHIYTYCGEFYLKGIMENEGDFPIVDYPALSFVNIKNGEETNFNLKKIWETLNLKLDSETTDFFDLKEKVSFEIVDVDHTKGVTAKITVKGNGNSRSITCMFNFDGSYQILA